MQLTVSLDKNKEKFEALVRGLDGIFSGIVKQSSLWLCLILNDGVLFVQCSFDLPGHKD